MRAVSVLPTKPAIALGECLGRAFVPALGHPPPHRRRQPRGGRGLPGQTVRVPHRSGILSHLHGDARSRPWSSAAVSRARRGSNMSPCKGRNPPGNCWQPRGKPCSWPARTSATGRRGIHVASLVRPVVMVHRPLSNPYLQKVDVRGTRRRQRVAAVLPRSGSLPVSRGADRGQDRGPDDGSARRRPIAPA